MLRKQPLEAGEVYHIFNKSIAGYKIFNTDSDYQRMMQALEYFSIADLLPKFSYFLNRAEEVHQTFESYLDQCFDEPTRRVKIMAYCLMPTHFHLILTPLKKDGATHLMHGALDSYARYFNIKHKRRGPLWVGRFKNVHVESDEQLLHLTRYVHLNPVTAHLTEKPEDWDFSSYAEYVTRSNVKRPLCEFKDLIDMKPRQYRSFTEDQIDYQRELAKIKDLILE